MHTRNHPPSPLAERLAAARRELGRQDRLLLDCVEAFELPGFFASARRDADAPSSLPLEAVRA